MRKVTVLFALVALLIVGIVPTFAQDEPGTIVDIAVANADFETLVAAVQAAGLAETLSGEGPFTVFAPTDDAFAAALDALGLTAEELLADTETLTQILTYHVVPGAVLAADVVNLESATTVQGEDIAITVDGDSVMVNNANVVATDIEASNGVIHVIDAVILPPSIVEAMGMMEEPVAEEGMMTMEEMNSMVHIRVAHFSPDTPAVDVYVNGELSAVQGLEFPAITDWISLEPGVYNIAVAPAGTSLEDAAIGPADFTLNAPGWITIAAVGSLEAGTLAPAIIDETSAYTDELPEDNARITVFHGIEDAPAVDVRLADGTVLIPALAFPGSQGGNDGVFVLDVPAGSYDLQVVPAGATEPVVIDLPGTEVAAGMYYLVAATGTLENPGAAVAATDLMALMMPAEEAMAEEEAMMEEPAESIVDIAVANEDFETLVAAVQAAGLAETLDGEGPFTVFAPTDDAFEAAFEALGVTADDVLADTEGLTQILLYHVVDGAVLAETVVGLDAATTLQGSDVTITVDEDGRVFLNDTIEVTTTDIQASNGVIHVIDGVLLPASE
jgi:transforming growth factor-beta-induced protein